MVTIVVLAIFSLINLKTGDKPHTRHVLSPGMYQCTEIQDSETQEISSVIEFEINNTNYIFTYDEGYFHSGKLYFCEEHQKLE